MPEEKYGDIDVNPIEAHLDPQDKTTTEIKETETVEKIEEDPAKTQLNSKDEVTEEVTDEAEEKEEVEIADHQDQDQNHNENQDQDENQDKSQNQIEATAEASVDNQPKLLAAKDTPLLLDTKVEDVPSADSQSTTKTPKKHKKAPVIALCTLTVLALGGSAFAYYYNTPEKVAADAITNYIKQSNKQMHTSGSIEIKPRANASASSFLSNLRLDFVTDTNHFNNNLSVGFNFGLKSGNNINFDLSAYIQEDGIVYLNLNKLTEAYQNTVNLMQLDKVADTNIKSVLDLLKKTLGSVEGKWWKFNIDEVVNSLNGTDFKVEQKQNIASAYNCVVKELKKQLEKTDQFAKNYLESPFLKIEAAKIDDLSSNTFKNQIKDYGKLYKASIDADKFVNFIKSQSQTMSEGSLVRCFQDLKSSQDTPSSQDQSQFHLDQSNIKQITDQLQNLYLGIDVFTHQLKGIYLNASDENSEYSGMINLDQNKTFSFNAPSNARPVSELITGLFNSQNGGLNNLMKDVFKNKNGLYSELLDSDSELDETDLL